MIDGRPVVNAPPRRPRGDASRPRSTGVLVRGLVGLRRVEAFAVLTGHAERGPQPGLDLLGDVVVVDQELPGILLALPQAEIPVGVPRARLVDDVVVDAEVDEQPVMADPDVVLDVELGLLERWGALVAIPNDQQGLMP